MTDGKIHLMRNLSRRMFLSMITALATSSVLASKSNGPEVEDVGQVVLEQPFTPYLVDPANIRDCWTDGGKWTGWGKHRTEFDAFILRCNGIKLND